MNGYPPLCWANLFLQPRFDLFRMVFHELAGVFQRVCAFFLIFGHELLQLIRFFANPCRYLLRERVGLDLPESAEVLDDVEPMLPDWSGQRALAARLLPVMLDDAMHVAADGAAAPDAGAGAVRARLWTLARAGNEYPVGALGEAALAR